MRGFLLGLASAALLAGLAYRLVPRAGVDPCSYCGTGTRCEGQRCVAARPAEAGGAIGKKRSRRVRDQGPQEEAAPAVTLRPADLKQVAAGDNLKGTEVINLAAEGGDHDRELTQEDLDAIFRPHQDQILACLDEARGEAQLSGRMVVSFRLQRSGAIGGVRVEAPAYLIQHGLLACVRAKINHLRFPPSANAQIVSYPFSLR